MESSSTTLNKHNQFLSDCGSWCIFVIVTRGTQSLGKDVHQTLIDCFPSWSLFQECWRADVSALLEKSKEYDKHEETVIINKANLTSVNSGNLGFWL